MTSQVIDRIRASPHTELSGIPGSEHGFAVARNTN
jgi:hypothetical protein